jgi:hypothetical protein
MQQFQFTPAVAFPGGNGGSSTSPPAAKPAGQVTALVCDVDRSDARTASGHLRTGAPPGPRERRTKQRRG